MMSFNSWYVGILVGVIIHGCGTVSENECLGKIEYYQNIECNIVVSDWEKHGREVTLIGYEPNSKHPTEYTYSIWFLNLISKGDTLSKEKGSFNFKLKGKSRAYIISLDCQNDASVVDSINF